MFDTKSLLDNYWELKTVNEKSILSLSQKKNISFLLAKLLIIRGVKEENLDDYLNPNILNILPDPFSFLDMDKGVNRLILALKEKQSIGIIADYDVDGSTSASILFQFLNNFNSKILLKIPNRLIEGYGPNKRIMDEMLQNGIKLVITLDCGTTSFKTFNNNKYKDIDNIIIDHHLSEIVLPNAHSIINPNRFDENNQFTELAAVGVTFIFLIALRKKLRKLKFFKNTKEPNLKSYLDLVALGTVCDVVKLTDYNRAFVKIGIDIIRQRKHKALAKMFDISKINSEPNALDLGFIVGPQLNAASRIDDSSLPSKLLISNDIFEIESLSRKLFLLNEKRKIIENQVYNEAIIKAEQQNKSNFLLVFGNDWHIGVLGIVASRLISIFNKPTIVISFNNNIGTGSARSIDNIDLGKIILNAKNSNILISGGGHSMAAGLKVNFDKLNIFSDFLNDQLKDFDAKIYEKRYYYDSIISVNELNDHLLDTIEKIEPYGNGNPEPKFIIDDLVIDNIKIIKEKHIILLFKNDFGSNLKGICFNCIGNKLGEYLINFKKYNFNFGCTIRKDNFSEIAKPQIVIKDAIII